MTANETRYSCGAVRGALQELPRFGRIGVGSATAGNLYTAITDEVAAQLFTDAWTAGVRHFDTSPHYGLGLGERRLGSFLQTVPRDEFHLSTKVGRLLVPNSGYHGETDPFHFDVPNRYSRLVDYRLEGVRRSVTASLARLGLTRIDSIYVHDPEQHGRDRTADSVRDGVESVCTLRDEGIVRWCGIGTASVEAATMACDLGDIDIVMMAGRWSLLDQSAADLLDRCHRHGIAVLIAGPYQSGLLATDPPRADSHFDYGSVPPNVLRRAGRIATICHRYGVDLPTAALQFPLRHPAVTAMVTGAASSEQFAQNAARLEADVPDELWETLREEGILL